MTQSNHICILRLSALGDVSNCLPTARAIQKEFPTSKLSWIIGRTEYELVQGIKDINWIVINKKQLYKSWRIIRKYFKHNPCDILLHMQSALRASLLSTAVKAPRVIGFDKQRGKDYQYLFCTEEIAAHDNCHMLDTYMDFARHLGISNPQVSWQLPIKEYQLASIKLSSEYVALSPCASKEIRNLRPYTYARIINNIHKKYKIPVVLIGGASPTEKNYAQQIKEYCTHQPLDLIATTTIRQMMAIIYHAKLMIAPDSGPAHLGAALGTPTIGLYANTNPERAGPYRNEKYLVNEYPAALKKYLGKTPDEVAFGTRVRVDHVMDLIKPRDVMDRVDLLLRQDSGIIKSSIDA